MKRILTSDEMYLCDRTEIETNTPSDVLMHRAARACADAIREILTGNTDRRPAEPRVLILCGRGNNGGDGILCARMLCEDGIPADICTTLDGDADSSPSCARLYRALSAGVRRVPLTHLTDPDDSTPRYTLIADALFGIGLHGEITGEAADLIDAANTYAASEKSAASETSAASAASHPIPTVAIDIASGIDADTGKTALHTFRATHTLAINNAKRGHLLFPGAACTGELRILDIGIPETPLDTAHDRLPVFMLTDRDAKTLLPRRPQDANKGTFGRVLIVAGSRDMCGAALLSALGAYRCGAGLVQIFTPHENRIPLLTRLPEAIVTTYDPDDLPTAEEKLSAALKTASAVVIGPGLGAPTSAITQTLVRCVLSGSRVPTVLDADALNCIAAAGCDLIPTDADPTAPRILTPHPGELSRLAHLPVPALNDDPIGTAADFASACNAGVCNAGACNAGECNAGVCNAGACNAGVCNNADCITTDRNAADTAAAVCNAAVSNTTAHRIILNAKSTRSVITDGRCAYINPTGTAALAKGGSGDVLTGITATLCAQGCDPLTAAALAAYLHGRAAEIVTSRMGSRAPLASEIADAIGEAIMGIETFV